MENTNLLSMSEIKDIIETVSILVTLVLGITSSIMSARNSRKLKDMETYKYSLKMKELEIEIQYKNNQLVVEEVHMLLTNIKNISCNSECYLFISDEEKIEKYSEVLITARESLIWVKKRISILSVYMNGEIYIEIKELFKMVKNLLYNVEAKNSQQFLDNYWEKAIQKIEEQGLKIIQELQLDNKRIVKE